MVKRTRNPIKEWGEQIDWTRRVKAVCKPCWELKYCPYGPLVEEFPLPEEDSYQSCRIFGHECPVFSVAEPLTETKDLRKISRYIPRPIQFKVLKRENQVCRACGKPVADEDIHFDHIIPWSKGGPTEESNIQLLCGLCNRKKSDGFEEKHLVSELRDHIAVPVGTDILEFLFYIVEFRHSFFKVNKCCPSGDDIAKEFNQGKKTQAEERAEQILQDFELLFSGRRPKDISPSVYQALKLRWGYADLTLRKLKPSAKEAGILPEDLLEAEMDLVGRLGWGLKDMAAERKKWIRT